MASHIDMVMKKKDARIAELEAELAKGKPSAHHGPCDGEIDALKAEVARLREAVLSGPDAPEPDGIDEDTYRAWVREEWAPWMHRLMTARAALKEAKAPAVGVNATGSDRASALQYDGRSVYEQAPAGGTGGDREQPVATGSVRGATPPPEPAGAGERCRNCGGPHDDPMDRNDTYPCQKYLRWLSRRLAPERKKKDK